MTLTEQHLPQFVQQHGPLIDSVTWLARVKEEPEPENFVIALDNEVGEEESFTLTQDASLNNLYVYDGTSNLITLGDEFTLSTTANVENLEELVLLIKYELDS